MLPNFYVIHYTGPLPYVTDYHSRNVFTLTTCLRSIVISLNEETRYIEDVSSETFEGSDAYIFLLELICGLKGRIIAENEIVNQFKKAYQQYSQSAPNPEILKIIEKLFQDAKQIRTSFLMGIGQGSMAFLIRKVITKYHGDSIPKHILLLGSGDMASDVIQQLKKHSHLTAAARNPQRLNELAKEHPNIELLDGLNPRQWTNYPCIINTIGGDCDLLDEYFFNQWKENNIKHGLFIDISAPCVLKTRMGIKENVVRLEQVYDAGRIEDEQTLIKIAQSRHTICCLAKKRFPSSDNYAWELNFAEKNNL